MKLTPKFRRRALLALVIMVLGFTGVSAVAAWWITAPVRHKIGAVPADLEWPAETVRFPAREDSVSLAGWFVPWC
jgi:hypothetical protein